MFNIICSIVFIYLKIEHYFREGWTPHDTHKTQFVKSFLMVEPVSGSAVAQSVERAAPSEEVPGLIPAVAARSLLVGSVSV